MKAAGRHHVNLDGAPTPSAAIDSEFQRRHMFPVEPAPRHPIHPVPKNLNAVMRIPGGNQHTITIMEIALAHLLQPTRLGHTGSQVVDTRTDVIPHTQICCATHPIKSTQRLRSANNSLVSRAGEDRHPSAAHRPLSIPLEMAGRVRAGSARQQTLPLQAMPLRFIDRQRSCAVWPPTRVAS
jgi:hypothetical protein